MTFGSGAYGCLGHGNCNDVSQVCLLVSLSVCLSDSGSLDKKDNTEYTVLNTEVFNTRVNTGDNT